MNQQKVGSKIVILSVLGVVGVAYCTFVYSGGTLTGLMHLDGIIGVVLGLYICSHPAGHLIELLFYRRGIRYLLSSRRSIVLWLVLNVLVLLISGVVIFVGTTGLIGKAD
jgi:energy-converting hydrogenase Eha subunit F